MSLFGNSKSSSSSNVTTNTLTNYNTGENLRSATNNNITGNTGTLTINASDYGAVQGSLELSRAALDTGKSSFDQSIQALTGVTKDVVGKALDTADKKQVSESAQLQQTLMLLALIGAAAFVAFKVLK